MTGAYCPDIGPGDSSSGSAFGSSIGLALAALGTETDGSILRPSTNFSAFDEYLTSPTKH